MSPRQAECKQIGQVMGAGGGNQQQEASTESKLQFIHSTAPDTV